MLPFYKRFEFWTLIVGAIVELVIGFGFPDQAALLASVAGTVIAALVAGGIITKQQMANAARIEQMKLGHQHIVAEMGLEEKAEKK